jgi:hypothetical protein
MWFQLAKFGSPARATGINNLEQRTTPSQTIIEPTVQSLRAQYGHPV